MCHVSLVTGIYIRECDYSQPLFLSLFETLQQNYTCKPVGGNLLNEVTILQFAGRINTKDASSVTLFIFPHHHMINTVMPCATGVDQTDESHVYHFLSVSMSMSYTHRRMFQRV